MYGIIIEKLKNMFKRSDQFSERYTGFPELKKEKRVGISGGFGSYSEKYGLRKELMELLSIPVLYIGYELRNAQKKANELLPMLPELIHGVKMPEEEIHGVRKLEKIVLKSDTPPAKQELSLEETRAAINEILSRYGVDK